MKTQQNNAVTPLSEWEIRNGLRRLKFATPPWKTWKEFRYYKGGARQTFLRYFNKQNSQAKSLVLNKWKRIKLPLQCFGGTLFFNEHCFSEWQNCFSKLGERSLSRYTDQTRPRAWFETSSYTLPAGRNLGVWQYQRRTRRSEELEDMKTTLSRKGSWKGIAKQFWGIIKLPIWIQPRLPIRLLWWIPFGCLSWCDVTRHHFPPPAVLQTSPSRAHSSGTSTLSVECSFSSLRKETARNNSKKKKRKGKAMAIN